jgi:rod shape-determining protein MreB
MGMLIEMEVFMAFSKAVGIDLGTANVLIYVKGEGIVLDEPSVVAIETETRKCLAVGSDAKDMLGRTPGRIQAIRPLKDGVIADFEVTEMMLNYFIKKLKLKGMFSRPTILICCPSNITSVERNAIRDAAYRAGAKRVYIEEEPKVAAIGAGLDIAKPTGNMVLDIGGGTTDVAILSLGEIVTSSSLKIAGDRMDKDIIKYVKETYKLLIGDRTAEEMKKRIGTAWRGSRKDSMEVSGRDLVTGLPHTITMTSDETETAIHESLQDIVRACRTVLEQTPPELSADIVTRGIVLTGGGALLHGMDQLLMNELGIPVYVAENALKCVAEGTGIMLENLHLVG